MRARDGVTAVFPVQVECPAPHRIFEYFGRADADSTPKRTFSEWGHGKYAAHLFAALRGKSGLDTWECFSSRHVIASNRSIARSNNAFLPLARTHSHMSTQSFWRKVSTSEEECCQACSELHRKVQVHACVTPGSLASAAAARVAACDIGCNRVGQQSIHCFVLCSRER